DGDHTAVFDIISAVAGPAGTPVDAGAGGCLVAVDDRELTVAAWDTNDAQPGTRRSACRDQNFLVVRTAFAVDANGITAFEVVPRYGADGRVGLAWADAVDAARGRASRGHWRRRAAWRWRRTCGRRWRWTR